MGPWWAPYLADVDSTYPLSRRFGVQQGPKVRCVDDFSRSGVNAWAQVAESPRPHTVDTFAPLCMPLMSGPSSKEQWKSRFFDLKGACRQCTVNPMSAPFAHIAVFDPRRTTRLHSG